MYSSNIVIGMAGSSAKELKAVELKWPEEGVSVVPDWVYTSQELYNREIERIFHGRTWSYVALEAEIPQPGDFIRSFVGPTPVVVARDTAGGINVFENRCAHRGVEFCRKARGNAKEFVCPYHQWTYDLKGDLFGVPFRRGVKGDENSGMPPDFKPEQHGTRKLKVQVLHGVVFASFANDMESVEAYLSPEILKDFEVVFKGRKLKIFGQYRNELPCNWKLYHENLKDPYHGTLLHAFLITFGLAVAGSKNMMYADPSGRHGTLASSKPKDMSVVSQETRKEMRSFRDDLKLADDRVIQYVPEFDSQWSVTMQTIWPNLIVQRELNTLGIRHIVPNGPHSMIMIWTMFGYEGDSEDMVRTRFAQGNLMGPAGYLGIEDNEALKFLQEGVRRSPSTRGILKLGGTGAGPSTSVASESALRAMFSHYREVMGL
jgi:anthranilate 1,2-dioxygenase large subunit